MPLDPNTLWEAFASGQWSGAPQGALGTQYTPADYSERIKSFYDVVVGPSFGYEDPTTLDRGFGSAFGTGERFGGDISTGLFGIGSEREGFEKAETEFRRSIGDPYFGAEDPFAWEKLSRYKGYGTNLGEAQRLLQGELYDKGGLLGGETGSAYTLGMEKEGEAYTTGMETQEEALTYGQITAGVGLASGTSGATLRSGRTVGQAEDILSEAYMEASSLGAEYMEGKRETEEGLRGNLDDALSAYLTAIESEKAAWYQGIMADVQRISGVTGTEDTETAFIGEQDVFAGIGEGYDWTGLTYEGELGRQDIEGYGLREDDPDTPNIDEGEICGIGEIYVEGEGCTARDLELEYNQYGEIYGTGEGTYANQGCLDPGACNYCPKCTISDDNCTYDCLDCEGTKDGDAVNDVCGVCGGDGSSCVDDCGVPNGDNKCVDDCGVPHGPGANIQCPGGEYVCNQGDCGVVDPAGAPTCGPGYVYIAESNRCVPEDEAPEGAITEVSYEDMWNWDWEPTFPDWVLDLWGDKEDPTCPTGKSWNGEQCVSVLGEEGFTDWMTVHCPDGTWARGAHMYDYSLCAYQDQPAITECEDGTMPDFYGMCPEDYSTAPEECGDCDCSSDHPCVETCCAVNPFDEDAEAQPCECVGGWVWSDKKGANQWGLVNNCPGGGTITDAAGNQCGGGGGPSIDDGTAAVIPHQGL